MNKDAYCTPQEVAETLNVSRGAVLNWIRKGKIKHIRLGPKTFRIPIDEVEKIQKEMKKFYEALNSNEWVPAYIIGNNLKLNIKEVKRLVRAHNIRYLKVRPVKNERWLIHKGDFLSWLSSVMGKDFNQIPKMVSVSSKTLSRECLKLIMTMISTGKVKCLKVNGKIRILEEDYKKCLALLEQSKMLNSSEEIVPLEELAETLKVSVATLRKALKERSVKILTNGGGKLYVRISDVKRFFS